MKRRQEMLEKLANSDERQFKALTGVSRKMFAQLLVAFSLCYEQAQQEHDEKKKTKRQRKPGGGRKGRLDTMEKKLFFMVRYLKSYPTYDVMGFDFEMHRANVCRNVHQLMPIVLKTLAHLKVLPQREFATVEELQEAWAEISDLFIDVTERPHYRPGDYEKQKEYDSGKKKHHTIQNTIISTAKRFILFLGMTTFGSMHDFTLFKQAFAPDKPWFEAFKIWVDLGYLGFDKNYQTLELHLPHKKPRKSKANPNPSLTEQEKEENREMSSFRVVVENAICGLKRFNILVHEFRNRTENFEDDVILACAGLHNLSLDLA
jgi:DDE superfamily endonuclease/Helix-turn-helix of DDE superfamily endonuclease